MTEESTPQSPAVPQTRGESGPPTQPAFNSLDKALKHLQIAEAWLIESIRHLHSSLGTDRDAHERYRHASDRIATTRAQIRLIKMAQLAAGGTQLKR